MEMAETAITERRTGLSSPPVPFVMAVPEEVGTVIAEELWLT